ncbi:MAG TPA: dynamin family protein [Pirellulales bacterium]
MDNLTVPLKKFGYLRDRLALITSDLSDVFGTLGFPQRASDLTLWRERLLEERFKILVLGDMKRGKSTLVNALLGERVLPTKKGLACTAIPTCVRYGEKKRAICYRRPPNAPDELDLVRDPGVLISAVTIPDALYTPRPEDDVEAVKQHRYVRAEVYWPIPICRNGVEIEDTAGLNEGGLAGLERAHATWEQTSSVDAIILVWSCRGIGQDNELKYLNNLRARGWSSKVLFIVYNHFDHDRHDEADLTTFRAAARRLLEPEGISDERIFFLSAEDALNAKVQNEPELLAASRMPLFENAIGEYLMTKRAAAKLEKSVTYAELARAEALSDVQHHAENKPRELVEKVSQARQRATECKAEAERISKAVEMKSLNAAKFLNMAVSDSVRTMIEELCLGVPTALSSISVSSWDAIFDSASAKHSLMKVAMNWAAKIAKAWQTDELTQLVLEHVRTLRSEIDDNAERVESIASELGMLRAKLRSNDGTNPAAIRQNTNKASKDVPEEEAVEQRVTEILNGVESDFSAGDGVVVASIIGGVITGWLAIVFTLAFLPFVIVGAVVAGIFGGMSAGERLKVKTVESVVSAIRQKGPELEQSIVESVQQRFDGMVAAVNLRLGRLCLRIAEGESEIAGILTERQKQADAACDLYSSMRTRLQEHAIELAEIGRHIDSDRGELPERVGKEFGAKFAAFATAMAPAVQEQSAGEHGLPTERELQSKLTKEIWGRLLTCENWLKTEGLWHPALRQRLGTIWAAAIEPIGESSEKEMAVFRAIVALHVAEGDDGVPKPEDIPRRWEDDAFKRRVDKLLDIVSRVAEPGYTQSTENETNAPAEKFRKAYSRAYKKYRGAAEKADLIDRRNDKRDRPF